MAEQWMSIVEYARTFNISDMTIRRRIKTGRLQAQLRDGKYFIPIETDPHTGEPVKQSTKPRVMTSPNQAMKYHPNSAQTLNVKSTNANYQPRAEQTSKPSTQHFNAPQVEARNMQPEARAQYTNPKNWEQLPYHLSATVAREKEVAVEANALLEYCNSSLAGIKEIEHAVEGRYAAKLETAHEQIKNRDVEIARLNQQIEDLQLLVQILERKKY